MPTPELSRSGRVTVTVLLLLCALLGGCIAGINAFAMAWTAGERHSSTSQVIATVIAFSIPAAITTALTFRRPAYALLILALVAAPTFQLYPAANKNSNI